MPEVSRFSIDPIDHKILSYLIDNARMPFLEIARECGISGAAIHQRVKKLEDAGVISGSRIMIDPLALGYSVCAYLGIQISDSNLQFAVVEDLKKIPEIVECNFITGKHSILAKVYCFDNKHFMHIIFDNILKIRGISQTETYLCLLKAFEREVNITVNKG